MDKIILLLISCFFGMNAIAQPTFFNSSSPKQSASSGTAAGQNPVLSPDDFSKKVTDISTKNNAAAQQAIQQKISELPPPKLPNVSIPKTADQSKQTIAAPSADEITDETETVTPSKPPKKPAAALTPPPAMQKEAPPESYSTTPAPDANGGSSNSFTGFGTGTGKTGTTTTPQNNQGTSSGGGWNIKY